MTCGKCGAGNAALYQNRRFLENGVVLDETSCMLCGWLITKPVFARGYRTEKPAPMAKAPQPEKVRKYPCTRSGCAGSYAKVNNKFSLCPRCSNQIRRWMAGAMTTPPPMIKTDDGWADNPETKGVAS